MSSPPSPLVVLLHGLWMGPAAMRPLAWRLARRGFRTRLLGYRSWAVELAVEVAALRARLEALPDPVVHLVGHSFGGLALLELHRSGYRPRGRAVVIGSPLGGSGAAGRLTLSRVGRWLVGRNGPRLVRGATAGVDGVELGSIAGNRPFGLGRLFAGVSGPSDGTVRLDETRLDGLADRIVVPATHSSLLLSGRVADEVATFLERGRFSSAADRPPNP